MRLLAVLAVLSGGALLAWAADPKREPPPRFPKSISDVFFPDAREKLVGPRPQRVTAAPKTAASNPAPPAAASPTDDDGKAGKWSKWISAEAIEDEIKAEQIKLSETVQSAAKFKGGGYQRARVDLSVLAAMLAIDAEYGEKVRWQRDAAAMRDRAARAGFNSKVGTDASFSETKTVSGELENMIRGNALSLGESTAGEWKTVADRPPLMKRLEQAQQQVLAPGVASSRAFSQSADKLAHDAQVVAALAEMILQDGYEYSDDESYQEFARAMQTAAVQIREAAAQGNYDSARQAVGELGKSCSGCHEGFRSQ